MLLVFGGATCASIHNQEATNITDIEFKPVLSDSVLACLLADIPKDKYLVIRYDSSTVIILDGQFTIKEVKQHDHKRPSSTAESR